MNTATTTTNGVRHSVTKGEITLDKLYKGDYQKEGTLTAQIRQIVTRKSFYPSKKVESTMQANIFDNKDFGFSEQEFESTETRVAWIPVPASITEAEVKAKLAAAYANGATIYRVLSNQPILDENQLYAISQGLTTKDVFANSQVVRYPKGDPNAGKIWSDPSGKVQYRRTFFWNSAMDDQDARGKGEPYMSPQIQAELAGASVMKGQTI